MEAAHTAPETTVRFAGQGEGVRQAIADVLEMLSRYELTTDTLGSIEIVLAEVLNNVCKHAYSDPTTIGPVAVAHSHQSGSLHFLIEDEGRAMPQEMLPSGQGPDISVDLFDLPESGFGWHIIHSLARDIIYERRGQRNILAFTIKIDSD